jgi:hypothetical protein
MVEGPGLTEQEKADLVWTIENEHKEGTFIDADGKLTIAEDELLGVLIVRATSVKNPAKFAEIKVTVLDKNDPAVVSIIVSAEGDAARVGPGGTLNFTATVTVKNSASTAVAWALTGNDKPGTALVEDPANNNKATLTVASDETAAALIITAASTVEGFTNIKNSITVSVTTGAVYLIGDAIDFDGTAEWPVTPGTAADKAMTKGDGFVWTWTGMMHGDKTFKFHDDTVTDWNNGTWYVANGDSSGDVSTAGTSPQNVIKATTSGNNNAWQTTAEGRYKITLDTAALTVIFEPIPEITGITVNGPETVVQGQSYTYTATVTAYHGASQAVTWSLTGSQTGSAINATTGVLTVDASETGSLTITATSAQAGFTTVTDSKTVSVADGAMYLIGDDFDGGWPATPSATSGKMMDTKSGNVFIWNSVSMTVGSTFKFPDDTVTGWDNGQGYVATENNVTPAGT